MKRITIAMTLLTVSLVALAQTPIFGGREAVEAKRFEGPRHTLEGWCRVQMTELPHDADGCKGFVFLPFGGIVLAGRDGRGVSIRFDWDSPEVNRVRRTEPFKSFTEKEWRDEIKDGLQDRDEFREFMKDKELWVAPIALKDDIDPYERLDVKGRAVDGFKVYELKQVAAERSWIRGSK